MRLTREDLRDELWDAMMNAQDIDVGLTDFADACMDRMDEIGIEAVVSGLLATPEASADTRRNGEDAVKLAAEFTSGAVPEGQTPKVQRHD